MPRRHYYANFTYSQTVVNKDLPRHYKSMLLPYYSCKAERTRNNTYRPRRVYTISMHIELNCPPRFRGSLFLFSNGLFFKQYMYTFTPDRSHFSELDIHLVNIHIHSFKINRRRQTSINCVVLLADGNKKNISLIKMSFFNVRDYH